MNVSVWDVGADNFHNNALAGDFFEVESEFLDGFHESEIVCLW